MKLTDLNMNKEYTYLDYLKWTFEERVELIKGRIFEMYAPNRYHQELSSYILASSVLEGFSLDLKNYSWE